LLFSCSWDMSLKMWNAKTFQLVEELHGYFSDVVSDLLFVPFPSKNLQYMWVASWDKSVSIWEIETTQTRAHRGSAVIRKGYKSSSSGHHLPPVSIQTLSVV